MFLKRRFPKDSALHKILNKNTLNVSYSCMGNVASVLLAQNRNILYTEKSEFGCSCRSKTDFPFNNKCFTPKIVYKAGVRNDTYDEKKIYLGVSETPFRDPLRNYKKELTDKKHCNSTEFSKRIWQLKDTNITLIVT